MKLISHGWIGAWQRVHARGVLSPRITKLSAKRTCTLYV